MDRSLIFILIFIVITGVSYYFWQEYQASLILLDSKELSHIENTDSIQQQPKEENKAVLYPVPETNTMIDTEVPSKPIAQAIAIDSPALTLDESDTDIQQAFSLIYQVEKLLELFIFRDFIRHVVVSIDNMTTKKLPRRFVFTQSPKANFMVNLTDVDNEYILDERNYSRYKHFLNFIEIVDNQQLLTIYVKYYPLFQDAYDELGYPGRYFNDRLVEVIDHILETPAPGGTIKLIRPKVFYQFADPQLEDLSAGQKVLIRMGPENATLIKTRLKSLRQVLTTLATTR